MNANYTLATIGPKGFKVTHRKKSGMYRIACPPNQPVSWSLMGNYASAAPMNHAFYVHEWLTIRLIHIHHEREKCDITKINPLEMPDIDFPA